LNFEGQILTVADELNIRLVTGSVLFQCQRYDFSRGKVTGI
jgi:hypothetical protein